MCCLWAAQGITDPRGFRPAPSAGALYPLELYIVVGKQRNGVVAQAVTGPYDVIAVVEAEDFTEMGNIVTAKIAHIPDVGRWTVRAEHHYYIT